MVAYYQVREEEKLERVNYHAQQAKAAGGEGITLTEYELIMRD